MKVGNAVVASQKQPPPNHRANAAQDDLELINAQHLGACHGAQSYRHPLACRKHFSRIRSARTSTRFLCSRSSQTVATDRWREFRPVGKRRGRERSPGEDLLLERSRLRAREVIRFEAELAPSKDKAALVIIMPWTTSAVSICK